MSEPTLRRDSIVEAWIANYQKEHQGPLPDCRLCGWPHSPYSCCGFGAIFGQVELGPQTCYVHSGNVDYLRSTFIEKLSTLGFHWKNEIFIQRQGEHVVLSHIEYYNGGPDVKQWSIPVNEFASMVEAVSVASDSDGRYARILNELGQSAETETP